MKQVLPVLLLLGACAAPQKPEPEIRIQQVFIEKPVACVPTNLQKSPDYPDTDQALSAAPNAVARYALVWAGRLLRTARLNEVEPVVTKCREAAGE